MQAIPVNPVRRVIGTFAQSDGVDLTEEFERRTRFMRTVPFVMRGAYREAMRVALDRHTATGERVDVVYSPPQTSALPPRQGRPRSEAETGGENQPIRSRTLVVIATSATRRRRRNQSDETKALRAERLASLGELSAARRALEGTEIALGTLATLAELTNLDRRPAMPREIVPPI